MPCWQTAGIRGPLDQHSTLARLQGLRRDPIVTPMVGASQNAKEDRSSAREELWPRVSDFAIFYIQVRQNLRCTSSGWDLHDSLKLKWRENDIVTTCPACAASLWNVRHSHGRSTADGNLL